MAHVTPHSRVRLLIPALLCFAYLAQCAWFIATQSLTFDETYHVVAGLDAWRQARFERWNDHPPLARLLFTLPVLGSQWQIDQPDPGPARAVFPSPEALAWRVRSVNALLGLLLAVLLWFTARGLWSEAAANFALALFVFTPALMAHFSVATTDGAAVLATFAAAVQFARWRSRPTRGHTVLLGLALCAMMLSKFHAPLLFALAVGFVLVCKPQGFTPRPREWNWRAALAIVGITALLIWAAYFFHVTKVTLADGRVRLDSPQQTQPLIEKIPTLIHATFYVPACEYLVGLGTVVHHNLRGHNSYFLGQLSPTGGWKLYFPVSILLKWPTVVLLLFVAAVILALRKRIVLPSELRWMLWFPAVFFVQAIFSRINIGDRHILPIYPFVLLVIAGLWHSLESQRGFVGRGFSRDTKLASFDVSSGASAPEASGTAFGLSSSSFFRRLQIVLLVAVLLNAADALRCAPDYLSWFNILVKRENAWHLLADSSLDWGQGLLALRRYEAEHPNEAIYLAYYGNVDPRLYGIRATPLKEGERVTGTVVVSSVYLAGRLLHDPDAYKWLLRHPRKALLNHTLHVFEVPPKPRPQTSR